MVVGGGLRRLPPAAIRAAASCARSCLLVKPRRCLIKTAYDMPLLLLPQAPAAASGRHVPGGWQRLGASWCWWRGGRSGWRRFGRRL